MGEMSGIERLFSHSAESSQDTLPSLWGPNQATYCASQSKSDRYRNSEIDARSSYWTLLRQFDHIHMLAFSFRHDLRKGSSSK